MQFGTQGKSELETHPVGRIKAVGMDVVTRERVPAESRAQVKQEDHRHLEASGGGDSSRDLEGRRKIFHVVSTEPEKSRVSRRENSQPLLRSKLGTNAVPGSGGVERVGDGTRRVRTSMDGPS